MRTYREIFAVGEFRVIFGTQCLVMASVSIGSLALGTITYSATASPVLTALAMFGGPLVQLVGSQFLLSLSDLLRPRTALLLVTSVMMVCEALQAMPGLPWPWRFLLMAVPWLVMSATSGTRIALMSEVLPAEAFVLGRSTLKIAVGVMQVAGYGAGGLLLVALSTTDLFAVSAALLLLAVIWLRWGLPDRPPRATGRTVVRRTRQVIGPLRVLLAVPYVACVVSPPVVVVAVLGMVASFGYSASLPLQERLLAHTDADTRGQVLGLSSVGMMVLQAVGALLGGAAGQWLARVSATPQVGAARGMSVMAAASVVVTLSLTRALRRSTLPQATS